MFGILRGKKTYVVAAMSILGAGASYATGDATAMPLRRFWVRRCAAVCVSLQGLRSTAAGSPSYG